MVRITRPNGKQVEPIGLGRQQHGKDYLATLHHGRYMDIVLATWDNRGHCYYHNFYIMSESLYPIASGATPFNFAGTYP